MHERLMCAYACMKTYRSHCRVCAKNITSSATCAHPAEKDYIGLQSEEKERQKGRQTERMTDRKKERNERMNERTTSQPVLCGSVLRGSDLQASASGGQRGEEEGRRRLQAQSRTATAVPRGRGTPPSCDKHG